MIDPGPAKKKKQREREKCCWAASQAGTISVSLDGWSESSLFNK